MAIFGKKKADPKTATTGSAKKTVKPKKETAAASESMKDLYSPAAKSQASKTKKSKQRVSQSAYQVLIKPLVTEKATDLAASNKYVFVVAAQANKIEIAKAVKDIYGVEPLKVNLANIKGKRVVRGRIKGQRSDWRKAVITLPAGQTIKIYEGV
ncbi:MAG: 50S ribosomal protein L23 [Patescibacteria group bacterium]|jgi:large subunit ribosomal protein L23